MADASQFILEMVIENDFRMVTYAWNTGMMWWLSASAFCLTLITKIYPSKDELKEQGFHTPIGIFVSLFLFAMILFGIAVLYELTQLENALYESFVTSCTTFKIPSVEHIFTLVRKLYVISTSTMVMFLCSWIYLWFTEKPFNIDRP